MKRILIWLGLVLVALSMIIWRAPASLFAVAIPPEFSRAIQLHEFTGTIWQGRALFSVTSVPPSLALAWTCRPSLSPIGVRCQLSESATALVNFELLTNVVHAERVTAQLPIQLSAAGVALAASPNVVANFPEIHVSKSHVAVTGSVRASDASYRLGGYDIVLGELTVDCAPASGASSSTCTLSNRGGGARLDGKFTISSGKTSGSLELTPVNGPMQRVVF